MHLKSEDVTSEVTFVVGSWKSNMTPAATLSTLATAAAASSINSPSSSFITPGVPMYSVRSAPSMTPAAVHPRAAMRRDPAPVRGSEEDIAKRNFVLEKIRRDKLTRRAVSKEANITDFRAMNYWLRGKELDDVMVKESGRKLCDWARVKDEGEFSDETSASKFQGKMARDDEEDEEDEEEATPASKRIKQMPTSSSSANSASYHLPVSTARLMSTPVAKRTASTPLSTPIPAKPSPTRSPFTPFPHALTPFNLTTPLTGYMLSPFPPFDHAQTPMSVLKSRSGSEDATTRHTDVTPIHSPATSPQRFANPLSYNAVLDEVFNGVDLPNQTPIYFGKTQSVEATPILTGPRSTPRAAAAASSTRSQRNRTHRQLSFEEPSRYGGDGSGKPDLR